MAGNTGVDLGSAALSCAVFKTLSSCGSNLDNYLSKWSGTAMPMDSSFALLDRRDRPIITASLNDNITVRTSWLHTPDVASASIKFGRIGTFLA
jgi:hypothetical protein